MNKRTWQLFKTYIIQSYIHLYIYINTILYITNNISKHPSIHPHATVIVTKVRPYQRLRIAFRTIGRTNRTISLVKAIEWSQYTESCSSRTRPAPGPGPAPAPVPIRRAESRYVPLIGMLQVQKQLYVRSECSTLHWYLLMPIDVCMYEYDVWMLVECCS